MKIQNLIVIIMVAIFTTACGNTDVPEPTGYEVINRNLNDAQRANDYRVAEQIRADTYNHQRAVIAYTEHPGEIGVNRMYHDINERLKKAEEHGKAIRTLRTRNALNEREAAQDEMMINEIRADAKRLNTKAQKLLIDEDTLTQSITKEVRANLDAYVKEQGRLARKWESMKNKIHISEKHDNGTQTHFMRDGSEITTDRNGNVVMVIPSKAFQMALKQNKDK